VAIFFTVIIVLSRLPLYFVGYFLSKIISAILLWQAI